MTRSDSPPKAFRSGPRSVTPLCDDMSEAMVDRLLSVPPFSAMDPQSFPRATPLRELIKNHARLLRVEPGEMIVREGDYGGSAFLLLDGSLRVALEKLGPQATGRAPATRSGWGRTIAKLLGHASPRSASHDANNPSQTTRGLFLQDFPTILDSTRTAIVSPGELFGELSAMTRTPRTATLFAEQSSTLLEIRWQGLRDLMRHDPALREHVDQLYRENSLRVHLRATPLLSQLSETTLGRVADSIQFQSFGDLDWRDDRSGAGSDDPYERALHEPIVIEEGQPVEGMLLVRGGFARVWRGHGEGRRTLSYLGKGQTFGAEELVLAALYGEPPVWRRSLTALGYLDVLKLPAEKFTQEVLPSLPADLVRGWVGAEAKGQEGLAPGAELARRLDFLVDSRVMNGVEAMVIDLERCTRCDDCVRACASTHEGAPRFVREGPIHDTFQFTQACMQCVDPVCMIGCPTGAIHRDEASGVVRISDDSCIGCSTCSDSCPYNNIQMVEVLSEAGVIQFDEETGQPVLRASKCDMCDSLATGPACQHACPHDALVRIDLSDPAPFAKWTKR